MRALKLTLIVILMAAMVAIFVFATWPAGAQDAACDLSGADVIDVSLNGDIISSPADAHALEPAEWDGVSTWIGGPDGHVTLAHEYAERYAWIAYVEVETIVETDDAGQPTGREWEVRTPLHYVEIRANPRYFYIFIMPNDRRENETAWHGCASFAVERGGMVEDWLDSLAG